MEIVCDNCQAKLNIPDSKIPPGQKVSISCPKCKNKLTLDSSQSAADKIQSTDIQENSDTADVMDDFSEFEEDETALEAYEEGVELALLLSNHPNKSQKMKAAIEELGFKCVVSDNTREALGKMRLNHFALVIVPDGFDGVDLNQSPIVNFLDHLGMSVRRRIFLALIGEKFRTMDHMVAFAMSANLVINPKDLDRLGVVLKRAIGENERFYRVFMEIMQEVGKA
jgi:predicted Zn finger-like uncharacterized protein